MDLFRNRPLALSCFAAVVLALAVFFFNLPHRWIFSAALLFCAILLFIIGLIRRKCGKWQSTAILTCVLAAILLFSAWNFFDRQIGTLEEQTGKTVTAEGTIAARKSSGGGQSWFALQLEELDGVRVRQKVLLKCEYLSALRTGERVRLTGTIEAFASISEDPDVAYDLADGFSGILVCQNYENCTVLASGERSLWTALSEWNAALSEKLVERLGKNEGGLAAALVLGNRTALNPTDTLAFRRVGISHFLALSGLHVGILIAALERLLWLLRLPRRLRLCAVVVLSAFYLAVTGASPSTVRAVLMATLLSAAFLLRRRYDPPTAIFAALFGILTIQPYAIADAGLWLSFLAAGGIVIFLPAIRKIPADESKPKQAIHPVKRMGKALLLSVSVGLFAFSATLPFSAFLFGEVSVLSVPATLCLAPLLSLALILSALCLFVPVPPVLFAAQKVLYVLRQAASVLSEWRGITVRLEDRITLVLVLLTAISLFLCAVLKLRKKRFVAIPLLLTALVFLSAYSVNLFGAKAVRVEYFSRSGNEYLLFTTRGTAAAVDFSGGNSNYAPELIDGLHTAGCTELEELIFTHYHTPATYLLGRVATKIKVRTLVLPTPKNEDETAVAARIREEAERYGIECRIADESQAVAGLTISGAHDAGMKEPAITVVAETETARLVWCNSQYASAAQTIFFRQNAADCDVFLFGQHGSTTGVRREIPELRAKQICVGEWKSGATPFLPSGGTYYQTVSGKIVFLL